jgi:prolyl-tRNA synthetase
MVMIHGDDKGLVLPPRVAPIQVVVIPVPFKGIDPSDECLKVVHQLQQADFRVKADLRDNYSPGWKYSHWELKGVPLRIEIGPRDIEKKQVHAVFMSILGSLVFGEMVSLRQSCHGLWGLFTF